MKGKGKIVQKQTMELHGITIYLLRKNIKNQYIRLRPDGGVQVRDVVVKGFDQHRKHLLCHTL